MLASSGWKGELFWNYITTWNITGDTFLCILLNFRHIVGRLTKEDHNRVTVVKTSHLIHYLNFEYPTRYQQCDQFCLLL